MGNPNDRSQFFPLVIIAVMLLSGCSAHFPVNRSFSEQSTLNHIQPLMQPVNVQPQRSNEILVVLAFSGGGMRASALSYGVLESLAKKEIIWGGKKLNLLDEVDMISSVSGGSFTAAYFGLNGRKIFHGYEKDFLKKNIEQTLLLRLINPWYWAKTGSVFYNRSELASDYYDETIFNGATFSDLNNGSGPAILINATDLTTGNGLVFHQEQFDWLCSDISDFPVSRAVTASSAVPGLFSAITLHNYGGDCGDQTPLWMQSQLWREQPELKLLAAKIDSYTDRTKRPYIHLIDGGIADNLGLRTIMERVLLYGGAEQALEAFNMRKLRKILIVSVNAEVAPNIDINLSEEPPTTFFTVDAATTTQLNLYNRETVRRFYQNVDRWRDEISYARCGRQWCTEDVDFHFVNVSLAEINDRKEREHLQQLPTTFNLSDDDVNRLVDAADSLLEQSEEFQRFLGDMH
ncbi:MAG: patatin-like phospholipase family protein [Gammaproteobacteria bacterium]